MREVIATGKTVEEATAEALAQLGLTEDEVTVEILDLPQKKLFKTIPAKVKVTSDEDMEKELAAQAAPVPAQKPAAPRAEKPAPAAPKAAPRAAERPAPVAAPRVQEPAETPAQAAADASAEAVALLSDSEPEIPMDIASSPKLEEAVEYLTDVCAKMGVTGMSITAVKQGEATILKLDGEGTGGLIGHRGETMEALSYLTSLVANRNGGDYLKLGLDINHYRSKREANLVALAKRIGIKVAKSGRSQTLEPMNPYERRIIHSAISTVEGVKSESTGEGANRRVCILSTAPGAKNGGDRPFRQADRRGPRPAGKGGPRRPGPNNRGPRPMGKSSDGFGRKSSVPEREFADRPRDPDAAPVAPKRTETINDGANLPLYGKIEL